MRTGWLLVAVLAVSACGGGGSPGSPTEPSPMPESGGPFTDPAYPEVWSINAFDGQSYEFKTNCVGEFTELETCFLWDVTAVIVEAPDGRCFDLDKDFNVNAYSGEVTRRWVLYGPTGGGLPAPGEYRFLYYRDAEIVLTQTVPYVPETIGYPTDIQWRREGSDLVVEWTPPAGIRSGMNYKVLVFPDGGNVVSLQIAWDARSARLPDIPLADGTTGTLNVAAYFSGGFAPSEYLPMTW